jgi:hypothetical protein
MGREVSTCPVLQKPFLEYLYSGKGHRDFTWQFSRDKTRESGIPPQITATNQLTRNDKAL